MPAAGNVKELEDDLDPSAQAGYRADNVLVAASHNEVVSAFSGALIDQLPYRRYTCQRDCLRK